MSGTVSTCLIAILSKRVLTIIRKVEKMKSDNQAKNCILCKVSIQNCHGTPDLSDVILAMDHCPSSPFLNAKMMLHR